MVLGVCLKGINAINFGSKIDFIFEFLPQLAFMLATFGYMITLIFIKWTLNFEGEASSGAPSIIN